jgi:hypothetical protein
MHSVVAAALLISPPRQAQAAAVVVAVGVTQRGPGWCIQMVTMAVMEI